MSDNPMHSGGWDFAAALNLINAGKAGSASHSHAAELSSPPSLVHSDSSDRNNEELIEPPHISLGNFDKIWQYLGTSAPATSFAELYNIEKETSRQAKAGREPKSVTWSDTNTYSVTKDSAAAGLEFSFQPPALTKQQRKKERRRLRKVNSAHDHTSEEDETAASSTEVNGPRSRNIYPASEGETDGDTRLAFKRSQERQDIIRHIVGSISTKPASTSSQTPHDLFLHQVGARKVPHSSPSSLRYNLRSHSGQNHTALGGSDPLTSLTDHVGKKKDLMQLLLSRFKSDWHTLAGLNFSYNTPYGPADAVDASGIHVFVDISNILIGFHDAIKLKMRLSKGARLPRQKLSFHNLSMVLERGRSAAKRCLAGSDSLECIEEARQIGYATNILERVTKEKVLTSRQRFYKARDRAERSGASSGGEAFSGPGSGTEEELKTVTKRTEQAVDEILHLHMMLSIVDAAEPSTIVLATGDAAVAEYSQGFLAMCERALGKGWNVEVVAFKQNMSYSWRRKDWLAQWDGRLKIIELDDFVEMLRL